MVMGLQGYYSLRKFNAESFLGSAVALGLLRELGPGALSFYGHRQNRLGDGGRDRQYEGH